MRRERRQKRNEAQTTSDLVAHVLQRAGIAGSVREHRIVTEWATIVGERIAARSAPDGLKNGVLYVRVSNSAWLQELSFLRDAMVESANKTVGRPSLVKEVRLHLGARRDVSVSDAEDVVAALARSGSAKKRAKAAAAPRPAKVVDAATLRVIEEDSSRVSDDELRELIRGVRKRIGL